MKGEDQMQNRHKSECKWERNQGWGRGWEGGKEKEGREGKEGGRKEKGRSKGGRGRKKREGEEFLPPNGKKSKGRDIQ